MILGSDGQFDGVVPANVKVVANATPEAIGRAMDALSEACAPCGPRLAGERLAELRALTAHRARGDVDTKLAAVAYTERLANFPTDVVTAACNAWADREEFWPSWAELKAECDKRMRGRLAIRRALEERLS